MHDQQHLVVSDERDPSGDEAQALGEGGRRDPQRSMDLDSRRQRARAVTIAMVCTVVALGLRLYGIRFGLPQLYYWDEPTVVNRAVRFGSGDFHPHYFYYPAFYMYVLFVVSGAYFVVGRLFGVFHGAEEFAKTYFVDPTGVYLTARITTALVGAAAVVVVWRIGKRYFDERVGLLGAMVLAVSPLAAAHAHVAITDTAHATLIAAACLPLHGVLTRSRYRDYALSGLLIGLGIATKYLAVLQVASLACAHWLRDEKLEERRRSLWAVLREAWSSKLFIGLAMVPAGFFVGSPYNFLAFREFVQDFTSQMGLSTDAAPQTGFLLRAVPADLGWLLAAAAFGGALVMIARRSRAACLFLTFPAVYALAMLKLAKVWGRYLLPQSAFLALMAAVGMIALYDWLAARVRPRVARGAWLALTAVALAVPASRTLAWDALMAEPEGDTRTVALRWTERTIPAGTRIVLQSLYDRTFDNVPVVTDKTLARLERIMPDTGRLSRIREPVLAAWKARPVYREVDWAAPVDTIVRSGARFVFLTAIYGPPPAELRKWLDDRGHVVQKFARALPLALRTMPFDGFVNLPVLPPEITVYEIAPEPAASP